MGREEGLSQGEVVTLADHGTCYMASPEPTSATCFPRTELRSGWNYGKRLPIRCSLLEGQSPRENSQGTGSWRGSYSPCFPGELGQETLALRHWRRVAPGTVTPRTEPYRRPLKEWLDFGSDSAQNDSETRGAIWLWEPRPRAWGGGGRRPSQAGLGTTVLPHPHQAGSPEGTQAAICS